MHTTSPTTEMLNEATKRHPDDQSEKRRYTPPALEPLGAWSALTLQQSVGIGPGAMLLHPSRTERLG